jgi:hypothetical protein
MRQEVKMSGRTQRLLGVFVFLTVNLCCPTLFGQAIPEADSRADSAVIDKAPALVSGPGFQNALRLALREWIRNEA